jgi:hypothetical protein
MKTVLLHLERLRRHYDVAVHTYDHVSLLDLSHSLRMWVDLKNSINDVAPRFKTTHSFVTASPSRKIMKAVRGQRFVFAFMPGGVIGYGNNGGGAFKDEDDYYDKEGIFQKEITCSIIATPKEDGAMVISNFCIVNRALDNGLDIRSGKTTRCNFIQWLGSDAVRMSYPTLNGSLESLSITREMIVRRMANNFDGSHPSITTDRDSYDNKFDKPIRSLLHFHLSGGLPLPYFILLKIAQDILAIAPKLLKP